MRNQSGVHLSRKKVIIFHRNVVNVTVPIMLRCQSNCIHIDVYLNVDDGYNEGYIDVIYLYVIQNRAHTPNLFSI